MLNRRKQPTGTKNVLAQAEVEGWVEKLMECNLLPETDIISLCKKAKEVFNQARKQKQHRFTLTEEPDCSA